MHISLHTDGGGVDISVIEAEEYDSMSISTFCQTFNTDNVFPNLIAYSLFVIHCVCACVSIGIRPKIDSKLKA